MATAKRFALHGKGIMGITKLLALHANANAKKKKKIIDTTCVPLKIEP